MRIAIAGSGRLATNIMWRILGSEHEIVGLIQNGRQTTGRKRKVSELTARFLAPIDSPTRIATRNRIPIVWLERCTEEGVAGIRAWEPDLILTCAFGIIFKKPLLDLPTIGCVNVHSSLLPKHRGPSPFSYAILAREKESGVTFHAMDEGIDTGDILDQASFPLCDTDHVISVYRKASDLAGARVLEVLEKIEAEGLQGVPQESIEDAYDRKLTHEDFCIDWTKSAPDIDALVRAAIHPLSATLMHGERTVRVARAHHDPRHTDRAPGTVIAASPLAKIATGEGTLTVRIAYCSSPFPFIWPTPWHRLRVGDILT